jgi:hypothetical protein
MATVDIQNCGPVIVEDIEVSDTSIQANQIGGILVLNSVFECGAEVRRCKVSLINGDGIQVNTATATGFNTETQRIVHDCEVELCANDAVGVYGDAHFIVTDCTIADIGTHASAPPINATSGDGITGHAQSSMLVSGNLIQRCRDAIHQVGRNNNGALSTVISGNTMLDNLWSSVTFNPEFSGYPDKKVGLIVVSGNVIRQGPDAGTIHVIYLGDDGDATPGAGYEFDAIIDNNVIYNTSSGFSLWMKGASTPNSLSMRRNIFGGSGSVANIDRNTGAAWPGTVDENAYEGTAFEIDGVAKTLAQWQSDLGYDAASVSGSQLTAVTPPVTAPDDFYTRSAGAAGGLPQRS